MLSPPRSLQNARPEARGKARLFCVMIPGAVLMILGLLSPDALIVVLSDGLVALAILLVAGGLGLWLVRALGLHRAELRWQLLLAAGLGLGSVSLLMLGLGTLGYMGRPLWIVLLLLFAVMGIVRIRRLPRLHPASDRPTTEPWGGWLWLAVIGFAVPALLGATMPPGILWPAEGNGYDVLEYHLGAPRDYFDAGRITDLPHNIYSNFPFNVEMLYLLSMILRGDPIAAVYTAKLLNVLLAMLAVAAVWLAGRQFGRSSGTLAAIMAATCPFLVYLSGVAYVENGLLFYVSLSLAAMIRAARDAKEPGRWFFVAGLMAGLACGCKYTAVPALVVPLALAIPAIVLCRRTVPPAIGKRLRRTARFLLLFGVGCLASFGPWLVKNIVATGNPVFPLAYEWFGARDGIWNDDGASRWHEGHLPAPEDRGLTGRAGRLWSEVLASKRFGALIFLGLLTGVAAAIVLLRKRQPATRAGAGRTDLPEDRGPAPPACIACWLMMLIGSATWLGFTHLVDRFAIVLIVPSALLFALGWHLFRAATPRRLLLLLLLVATGWNLITAWGLFTARNTPYLSYKLFGKTQVMTSGLFPGAEHIPVLNDFTRDKVLVVGDARRFYLPPNADCCVVFNRNPFAEAAERLSATDLLHWLGDRGYAYVYVDWSEMRRLRNSRYGFWRSIDRDLFRRLVNAGLQVVNHFVRSEGRAPYGTLFKLPAAIQTPSPSDGA